VRKFKFMGKNNALIDQILTDRNIMESWVDARKNGDYDKFGFAGGDEIETFNLALLRFSNQFPVVCYSFGISWEALQKKFPQVYSAKYHYENVKGPKWPTFENLVSKNFSNIDSDIVDEIFDTKRWDWWRIEKIESDYYEGHYNQYFSSLTITNQIDFVSKNKTRIPKNVLEIGGGRGEVANFFKHLGCSCLSIEPGQHADFLYNFTGKHIFGKFFDSAVPLTVQLKDLIDKIDMSEFDTVIFCESIEHVVETDFWNFWEKCKSNFHGLVIIANWVYYHPIPCNLPEHIFEINDKVYETLILQSKKCVYRNGSHLVLEL